MKNLVIACDSYIPVYSTCILPVFYALTSCRAVLSLIGMQIVVVMHVLVMVKSEYMPICPHDIWFIVTVLCKTNTENLPDRGCINWQVVDKSVFSDGWMDR